MRASEVARSAAFLRTSTPLSGFRKSLQSARNDHSANHPVGKPKQGLDPRLDPSGPVRLIPRLNQYQSTMDAPYRVEHCFGMESRPGASAAKRPLPSVVDDDESVRESLPDLLREFGFSARAFSSAEEFISSDCVEETPYLILDVTMPGIETSAARGVGELQCV